jgi:hypothetical protein
MSSSTIKIGQASINEHGGIYGGQLGDQTGREVYIVDDYNVKSRLAPTVLLRPKSAALAERSARACEAACNNDNIGYSQSVRDTLYTEATKVDYDLAKITAPCDTDCSAFMTLCAVAGGAKFGYFLDDNKYGSAPSCGSMRRWFTQHDDYTALTSSQYLENTDYLKRGDILVNEKRHTVMVLSNGELVSSITALQVELTVDDIRSTEASFKLGLVLDTVTGQDNQTDEDLTLKHQFELYDLYDNRICDRGAIKLNNKNKFTISKLTPNRSYTLKVLTFDLGTGDGDITAAIASSPRIIFSTLPARPSSISNLKVIPITKASQCDKYIVSFAAPDNWGSETSNRGYRVSIIKDGAVIAYKDNFIKNGTTQQIISISDFAEGAFFSDCDDILQIGIQTWIKDKQKNIVFDTDFPVCSVPIYLKPPATQIDKIHLRIGTNFKRTILYNTTGRTK